MKQMLKSIVLAIALSAVAASNAETLRYHTLVLDSENKILPWYTPTENAYDHYLDQLWTWLPTVPNGPSSSLPMYYLYCGFQPGNPITPNNWENDWGERIPNFVQFGRLYYAYTGNMEPLNIAKDLVDYALAHGMTPSNYVWANFPYGTANAGATKINGDNVVWNVDDILIDLGSDMGASFYKLYLVYGTPTYRTAAINVADTLAGKIKPGSKTDSPWPYVANARTGAVTSRYTSNFAGALTLFDLLIEHGEPNAATYATARQTLRNWILQYPMQDGNWVDGHSDVFINGNTNWSNTTKSNMNLYLLEHPDFDPNFLTDVPKLLKWTEDNMVNVSTSDGLSGQYYGAAVVAEQFAYMMRMGYQTSRQAAEYAGWYAVTGNETYKDKAYRGFNYSTYMMKSNGESSDGPTDAVGYWWGDVYGEGPRMFFYGFKAVPEWAPPRENHILYSKTVLKNITYASSSVQYTATDNQGTEYLRLAFLPNTVTANETSLSLLTDLNAEGYTVRALGGGDYAVTIRRARSGNVTVSGDGGIPPPSQSDTTPPTVMLTAPADGATVTGSAVTVSADASDNVEVTSVQFLLDEAALGSADTTSPYSITWDTTTATNGTHTLSARASDADGNTATATAVTVMVANTGGVATLWPAMATPAGAADVDTVAVELGVKFRSSVAGSITGIRFYKSSTNTGPHVGNLWNSSGNLLATVPFSNETPSGWQQAHFASPVAINANTVYVASYHAPNGQYSVDDWYFARAGVTNGPLYALRNGESGGNGVYVYDTNSAFPTETYRASNYWVDVIFTASP